MRVTSDSLQLADQPNPLRLTICPNCFYSLQGLPEDGVCPECGTPYDQSAVVLYGCGRQTHREMQQGGVQRAIWWIAMLALWFLIVRFDRNPRNWVIAALFILSPTVFRVIYRRTIDAPGSIQLRLDSTGCSINVFQIGRVERRHVPWRRIARFEVVPQKRGGQLIRLRGPFLVWKNALQAFPVVVELTDAEHAALVTRVERWRREATGNL